MNICLVSFLCANKKNGSYFGEVSFKTVDPCNILVRDATDVKFKSTMTLSFSLNVLQGQIGEDKS